MEIIIHASYIIASDCNSENVASACNGHCVCFDYVPDDDCRMGA